MNNDFTYCPTLDKFSGQCRSCKRNIRNYILGTTKNIALWWMSPDAHEVKCSSFAEINWGGRGIIDTPKIT